MNYEADPGNVVIAPATVIYLGVEVISHRPTETLKILHYDSACRLAIWKNLFIIRWRKAPHWSSYMQLTIMQYDSLWLTVKVGPGS